MKVRSFLATIGLVFSAVPLVLSTPAPACAAEGPHAALVIDTGESGGQYSLCVALDADTVSGIRLIELAGEQYDLSYRLGFGGKAVCELAGVGTEDDDCFSEYPDFWGYWHGDGSGGWSWAGSGAGSHTVKDGDVEGWSWGSGSDGSSHPSPPSATFMSVCGYRPQAPAAGEGDDGAPKHERDPQHRKKKDRPAGSERGRNDGQKTSGSEKGSEGQAPVTPEAQPEEGPSGDAQTAGSREEKKKERSTRSKDDAAGPEVGVAPTPSPPFGALPASARTPDEGPPVAGLVGVAGALVLIGAAALVLKRRSRTG